MCPKDTLLRDSGIILRRHHASPVGRRGHTNASWQTDGRAAHRQQSGTESWPEAQPGAGLCRAARQVARAGQGRGGGPEGWAQSSPQPAGLREAGPEPAVGDSHQCRTQSTHPAQQTTAQSYPASHWHGPQGGRERGMENRLLDRLRSQRGPTHTGPLSSVTSVSGVSLWDSAILPHPLRTSSTRCGHCTLATRFKRLGKLLHQPTRLSKTP